MSASFTRRKALQFATAGGLAALAGVTATRPALAAESGEGVTTRDLGAAVVAFTLPSGILVGDTVYMASRNIEPMKIVGYHLPTRKVTSIATGSGLTSQALGADPAGRYLYVGVDHERAGHHNLYRLDLTDPTGPIEDLAEIEGLNIIALTVSPDGQVFFCGTEKSPKVYQYDPVTRKVTDFGSPDPLATMGRAIVATESTVFYGSGSVLSGGGDASRAEVFAVDRATGAVASITPPEIAAAPVVRDLQIIGDQLAVGTQGSPTPAPFAFIGLDDYSSVTVVDTSGTSAKLFREHDDRVYFVGLTGIGVHTPSTGAVEKIKVPGIEYGEVWGLFFHRDRLHAVSAYGMIFEIDISAATPTANVHDLVEAGAPTGPLLLMGLAAAEGHVYASGTNAIARHSLRSGEVENLRAPGEAKDMLVRGRTLYTGQYSGGGVMAWSPDDATPFLHQVTPLGEGQNRPHDVHWDPDNRLLLIGTQNDTGGGGAICTYDPATDRQTVTLNPFDERQMVRSVTTHDGIAYLGGDSARADTRGILMAWDPVRRTELWRLDPKQSSSGFAGLAVLGRHLYAMGNKGQLFVIDRHSRAIVHTADHRSIVPDLSTLLVHRGHVYGASRTTLYRIDRKTFEITALVTGLAGKWYGIPRICVDERGRFYVLRDRNLIQVTIPHQG